MWLLLATAIVSAFLIIATHGRFGELTRLRIAAPWLLLAGLAVQALLEYVSIPRDEYNTLGYGLLMISYVLILGFCLVNLPTRGFGLISIGIALNALVIGLNLGMPTKPIGDGPHGNRVFMPVTRTVKHRQESGGDLLTVLDNRILFPRPFDELVSIGDLIMAAGICELAYYGSRRPAQTSVTTDEASTAKD